MRAAELPPLDVSGRLAAVRSDLDAAGCDVLVVSARSNVRWLTGFTGSAGVAVVSDEHAVLVTDGRYGERAIEELGAVGSSFDVAVTGEGPRETIAAALRGRTRLGLEADHVTWAAQRTYAGWFGDDGADLVAVSGVVERHRARKDAAELARIRCAAAIADAAFAEVLAGLSPGATEREIAAALTRAMEDRGADGAAFGVIVASGANAARPHHEPADRTVRAGDLVIIDCGALVDGYRSDMTRTVALGEPAAADVELFHLVAEAQRAGVAAVAPDVVTGDVDAACRSVIAAAGHGDHFVHGTGHGVGLDVHEPPRVAAGAQDLLAPGVVLTVEPGVYLPQRTGVRIEDTVAVTAGGAEVLTCAPKTLVVAAP